MRDGSSAPAKAAIGNRASRNAWTPIARRSPPVESVTASVASVANRPAPAKSVGRYCATLTENPTARAKSTGFISMGSLMRQNTRPGDAPRQSALRAYRSSRVRQGSARERKT